MAVEHDPTLGGGQHAADHVERRRLAGSVGADQPGDGVGVHGEIDPGHREVSAEADGEFGGLKQRHGDPSLRIPSACSASMTSEREIGSVDARRDRGRRRLWTPPRHLAVYRACHECPRHRHGDGDDDPHSVRGGDPLPVERAHDHELADEEGTRGHRPTTLDGRQQDGNEGDDPEDHDDHHHRERPVRDRPAARQDPGHHRPSENEGQRLPGAGGRSVRLVDLRGGAVGVPADVDPHHAGHDLKQILDGHAEPVEDTDGIGHEDAGGQRLEAAEQESAEERIRRWRRCRRPRRAWSPPSTGSARSRRRTRSSP